MENILVGAYGLWFMFALGFILTAIGAYILGHDAGYDKGRRDERIKQYKELQNKKATFIDAD